MPPSSDNWPCTLLTKSLHFKQESVVLWNSRYCTPIFIQLGSKYPVTQFYFLIITGWIKDWYWALLVLERVLTEKGVEEKKVGGKKTRGRGGNSKIKKQKYKESCSNTSRAPELLPSIMDVSFLRFLEKKNKYLCFQTFLTPVSLMPPISTCSHL